MSVDQASAALYLPLPASRGNVPYDNVQPGHRYTFFLYTPNKGRLLVPGIVVTGNRPGGNSTSNVPEWVHPPTVSYLLDYPLVPSHTYTTWRSHEEEGGFPCAGLPLIGTGGNPGPDFGTIAVGYSHYYDPDDGLISCPSLADIFYRGAVRFDLSHFQLHDFVRATLKFRIQSSVRHDDVPNIYADRPGVWSAAAGVDRATDDWIDWQAGDGHDYVNGDHTQLPVPSDQVEDPTITVDVSGMVRDWLNGNANNGFVFYGKDEGYPRNSEKLFSTYTDFVLTLTYL